MALFTVHLQKSVFAIVCLFPFLEEGSNRHFKHGQTKLMRIKTAYRFPRSSCINFYLNDVLKIETCNYDNDESCCFSLTLCRKHCL